MKKSKSSKDHKKKKSHRDSVKWQQLNRLKQQPGKSDPFPYSKKDQ